MKKIMCFLILLCVVLFCSGCTDREIIDAYKQGTAYFESGDYKNAEYCFAKCGEYKDSQDKLLESKYLYAVSEMDEGNYEKAKTLFNLLKDYKDSAALSKQADKLIQYNKALELLEEKEYKKAYDAFSEIKYFEDSQEYLDRFEIKNLRSSIRYTQTNQFGQSNTAGLTMNYDSDGNLLYVRSNGFLRTENPMIHAWDYNPFHVCNANGEKYDYDDAGRLTKVTGLINATESNGMLLGKTVYEVEFVYGENDMVTQELVKTSTDGGTILLSYDANGRLITSQLDRNNSPSRTYYYDQDGNLSGVVNTDEWYCEYSFAYKYDEAGRLAEKRTNCTVDLGFAYAPSTETYEYNEDGTLGKSFIDYDDTQKLDVTVNYSYKDFYFYNAAA